ncbi:MAG TPA: histidine phosphatase family protein [Acidimicrobiales bacterium]|nr:histidine phosphatase family protein [Acidimicrobiales bacterium]
MSGEISQRGPKNRTLSSRVTRLRTTRVERSVGPRYFLVRHGETALNTRGVLRGRLDPELDLTGFIEAWALSEAIGRSGISLVVASPLKRATDTATHIATRAGVPVETDGRLIDRDYGSWAGKPKSDVIARWGSLDAAPEIEPAAEVFARAMDAFLDVTKRLDSGSAALVTHDAVLQLLLPALDPGLEQDSPIPQATGCFNIVEPEGDGWEVTQLNISPGESATPPRAREGKDR